MDVGVRVTRKQPHPWWSLGEPAKGTVLMVEGNSDKGTEWLYVCWDDGTESEWFPNWRLKAEE